MKLCEVLDLTTTPKKYPEIKYPNQYDNENWGKNKKVELKDVIVRDTKTRTIYGRRTIAQRKAK